MAWFGDGLSSLSNLKGQITSFTKEVLSESVVSDTDEQAKLLEEANIKCVQLQDLLNSRDAEISVLRRQNCELQNAVVESNVRGRESNAIDVSRSIQKGQQKASGCSVVMSLPSDNFCAVPKIIDLVLL
ncbi:GSCOCG00003086001-RA-CDS, partial [Cotesia congregata]